MNGLNIGYGVVVIQSFAIFAGLSSLLGRVYFTKYYEVLKVPTSEIDISLTDYAVISPDVTILGIGIAITYGLFWWWRRELELPHSWNWQRMVTGVVLIAVYAVGEYLLTRMEVGLGLFGLWRVGLYAAILFGFSVFIYGAPWVKENEGPIAVRDTLLRRLILIAAVLVVGIFIMNLMLDESIAVAERDAEEFLQTAPTAHVIFTSSGTYQSCLTSLDTNGREDSTDIARVVHISDQFMYLQPVSDSSGLNAISGVSITFRKSEPGNTVGALR